jgi:hypothetical protein
VIRTAALIALLLAPVAVQAQDQGQGPEARFCPNRPDLGSGACTTDPGRVLLEFSAIDWQRQRGGGARVDDIRIGDLLVRTGIDDRTELQLSASVVGIVRERGKVRRSTTSIGDLRVAVRRNLRNPDGDGFAVAVEPFAVLPTGKQPVGAGDWAAGVALPVAYDLGGRWSLGFTGELAAAVDGDGDGRHAAALGILGLGYAITDTVGVVGEVSLRRDDDPAGGTTETAAALSLAWQPRPGLQWDVLAVAGLNRSTPDVRLAIGGAILF